MKSKWIKKRHQITMGIIRLIIRPIAYFKFGFRYQKLPDKKQYLILSNHQTVWDQFLVGLMCSNKTYFVMSDDLTTIKFFSKLLKFLLHPIPYKKSSTDFTILRSCRQVVSEKGSVMIFPEGNRTYSGKTEYINPTIIKMMKFLKLPVAIIHLEGGYGKFPRWANKSRKGHFVGNVYKIYQYEEYKDLDDKKLYEQICNDLFVDDIKFHGIFDSKRSAEYLERVLYNCPYCGFTHFRTSKDLITCCSCNMTLQYCSNLKFIGINTKAPFDNVRDWYIYQQQELYKLKLSDLPSDKVIFEEKVKIYQIINRDKKCLISKFATLKMYNNRIVIEYFNQCEIYMFDDISSAGVFGKNKMNFFIKDRTYQFLYDEHFNAMKFVNLYYKYRIEKGDNKDDYFLGL